MPVTVALVGSGPTALYCLNDLLKGREPVSVTLIEKDAVAGRGMPYSDAANSPAMLANIASIEIPVLTETLVAWLTRQSDEALQSMNVSRDTIGERTFFPRLVLGEFFAAQLGRLEALAAQNGHGIEVLTRHEVVDVIPGPDDVTLAIERGDGAVLHRSFDHVVLATGHSWPDAGSGKSGYYPSPWPAEDIARIPASRVGILGTSLSAFDVMAEVARANGLFHHDAAGTLTYAPGPGSDGLSITLLSRKGVLPEADFYCPLPARAPEGFSPDTIRPLANGPRNGLLDRVFALFFEVLRREDPDYCSGLGLLDPGPEAFAAAYFARRESEDPFVHAARNLAEARQNQQAQHTVPWRYAILGMHEAFGSIAPFLDGTDQQRFNRTLKSVFADNYATVPHQAIERLLALRNAGIVTVEALGDDYRLDREQVKHGAAVEIDGRRMLFDHFVDATGQHRMGRDDLPFPSLRASLEKRIGGAEDDDTLETHEDFRLRMPEDAGERIYCLALPYLIGRFPFIQGLTAARDLGATAAVSILSRQDARAMIAA